MSRPLHRAAIRRGALLCLGALLLAASTGRAQQPLPGDAIVRHFFPPDVVLRHADEIGLSREQREKMMTALREARRAGEPHHQRVRETSQKLAATLQATSVDEQQMLTQLDEVIQEERAIKRNQLTMLARVKNQLSAEQQEKLRALMGRAPGAPAAPAALGQHYENLSRHLADMRVQGREGSGAEEKELRTAIAERLQKVRAGVDRWRSEQRDPAPVVELMKNFAARMQSGDLKGARDQIDQAAKTLEADD